MGIGNQTKESDEDEVEGRRKDEGAKVRHGDAGNRRNGDWEKRRK